MLTFQAFPAPLWRPSHCSLMALPGASPTIPRTGHSSLILLPSLPLPPMGHIRALSPSTPVFLLQQPACPLPPGPLLGLQRKLLPMMSSVTLGRPSGSHCTCCSLWFAKTTRFFFFFLAKARVESFASGPRAPRRPLVYFWAYRNTYSFFRNRSP